MTRFASSRSVRFSPSKVKSAPTFCCLKSIAAFSAASNPSPGRKRLTARLTNPHRGTCVESHRFCAHHNNTLRIRHAKRNASKGRKGGRIHSGRNTALPASHPHRGRGVATQEIRTSGKVRVGERLERSCHLS